MKKIFLMVAGVLITALLVIRIMNKDHRMSNTEGDEPGKGGVSQSGGAQASATKGREASAPPNNEPQQSVKSVDDSTLSDPVKALLGQDGKG